MLSVLPRVGDYEISDGEFSLLGFTMFRRDRASEHRGGECFCMYGVSLIPSR